MLAHLWTVALRSATDTARILVLCIVLVETLELIINGSTYVSGSSLSIQLVTWLTP